MWIGEYSNKSELISRLLLGEAPAAAGDEGIPRKLCSHLLWLLTLYQNKDRDYKINFSNFAEISPAFRSSSLQISVRHVANLSS